jgi:hypothetical protein
MSTVPDPTWNHLLRALPDAERERWSPHLESVDMPLGAVLYESGATLAHIYFPTTAIVSLLYMMESGASAEIAIVGNEGLVGVSLFMGGQSTTSRAVVQSGGHGYRMKARSLDERIQPLFSRFASASALYAGPDHADVANRRVQSAPQLGSAAVSLALAESGPSAR